MRPPSTPRTRGEMKAWLKLTLRSGVLDALGGPGSGFDPEEARSRAADLLARLQQGDGSPRGDDPLVLEFEELHDWIGRRRHDQRRRELQRPGRYGHENADDTEAEAKSEPDRPSLGKPAGRKPAKPDPYDLPEREPSRLWSFLSRLVPGRRPRPVDLDQPLWDRWLDQ